MGKYRYLQLPLLSINVLPQVRKTFEKEGIEDLANNIVHNGLIQPPTIAIYTEAEMQSDLHFINLVKGLDLSLGDMKYEMAEDGTKLYYRLIAGERRFRAHMSLYMNGCKDCREAGRSGEECYVFHFDSLLIEARARPGIDPIEAKSIQFHENTYSPPPVHEEAYELEEMYRFLKKFDPSYNMTKFSRFAGVGTEKIRRALLFTELPEEIQALVKTKTASMSHVLELKPLVDLGEKGKYLLGRAIEILQLHQRVRVEEFHKQVQTLLDNLTQHSLFGEAPLLTQKAKRQVVAREMISGLAHWNHYLHRVRSLRSRGVVGRDKPFSGISPGRWIVHIMNSLEELVPGFHLTTGQRQALERVSFEKTSGVLGGVTASA